MSNSVTSYSSKDTFPASTAGDGTITTNGVRFATTDDNSLSKNDWIYSPTENVCRRITSIVSGVDTKEGTLDAAFPSDLSAENIKIIKSSELKYYSLGVTFSGGAGVINNVSWPADTPVNFYSPSVDDRVKGLDPVVIDPAGNTAYISFQRY